MKDLCDNRLLTFESERNTGDFWVMPLKGRSRVLQNLSDSSDDEYDEDDGEDDDYHCTGCVPAVDYLRFYVQGPHSRLRFPVFVTRDYRFFVVFAYATQLNF